MLTIPILKSLLFQSRRPQPSTYLSPERRTAYLASGTAGVKRVQVYNHCRDITLSLPECSMLSRCYVSFGPLRRPKRSAFHSLRFSGNLYRYQTDRTEFPQCVQDPRVDFMPTAFRRGCIFPQELFVKISELFACPVWHIEDPPP